MTKLTPLQWALLADCAECEQWFYNIRTAKALQRKGLADLSGRILVITDAGRAALLAATPKGEPL